MAVERANGNWTNTAAIGSANFFVCFFFRHFRGLIVDVQTRARHPRSLSLSLSLFIPLASSCFPFSRAHQHSNLVFLSFFLSFVLTVCRGSCFRRSRAAPSRSKGEKFQQKKRKRRRTNGNLRTDRDFFKKKPQNDKKKQPMVPSHRVTICSS